MPENENRDVNGIMSILKGNQEFKNMMIEQTNEYKNSLTNKINVDRTREI